MTGKAILALLREMCDKYNMTVIVITHNSALAPMADRVIHLKNGKVDQIRQYVSCYDFIVVSKGYNYSGVRDLAIGLNKEKEYSWKDTFLADLSQSRLSGLEKQYGVLPAWGVTDYSDISNVTVDDQKIDEVHEIDVDGETYYLWIIYDLQTQNKVSDVIIE